jgi:hypothetical protein
LEETNEGKSLEPEQFVTALPLLIMSGMLVDSDTTFLVLANFVTVGDSRIMQVYQIVYQVIKL